MKLAFRYRLPSVAALARIGGWLNRPRGPVSPTQAHPERSRIPTCLVVIPLLASSACGSDDPGGAGGSGAGTTGATTVGSSAAGTPSSSGSGASTGAGGEGAGGGGGAGPGGSGGSTSVGSSGSSTATTGPGGAGGSGSAGGSGGGGSGGASQGGGGLGGEGGSPPDRLVLGDPCAFDAECQSEACVEGVCCTTACDAGCESCLAALSGGTNGTCAPIAAEVVCRAPTGSCDVEETCDGLSPSCPADAVAPGGAVCRAVSGVCDLEETCDGLSSQCPADQLDPVSVCRSAASPCDAEEMCSGSDADCPPDQPVVCNVDGQLCIEGACGNARRVFVTSTTTNGDLGGVSGADATCQARAIAGGLTGTYKAWVSTSASSPVSTFAQSAVPYVQIDGTKIADDWADLIDGSLDAPLLVTELGLPLEPGGFGADFTWTATGNNGAGSSPHCVDWTSASSGSNGVVGNAREASSFSLWLNRPCDSLFHLYCFEQ